MPIGIYWGGYQVRPDIPINVLFLPSIIPLIIDNASTQITYNIFNNFINKEKQLS